MSILPGSFLVPLFLLKITLLFVLGTLLWPNPTISFSSNFVILCDICSFVYIPFEMLFCPSVHALNTPFLLHLWFLIYLPYESHSKSVYAWKFPTLERNLKFQSLHFSCHQILSPSLSLSLTFRLVFPV